MTFGRIIDIAFKDKGSEFPIMVDWKPSTAFGHQTQERSSCSYPPSWWFHCLTEYISFLKIKYIGASMMRDQSWTSLKVTSHYNFLCLLDVCQSGILTQDQLSSLATPGLFREWSEMLIRIDSLNKVMLLSHPIVKDNKTSETSNWSVALLESLPPAQLTKLLSSTS